MDTLRSDVFCSYREPKVCLIPVHCDLSSAVYCCGISTRFYFFDVKPRCEFFKASSTTVFMNQDMEEEASC